MKYKIYACQVLFYISESSIHSSSDFFGCERTVVQFGFLLRMLVSRFMLSVSSNLHIEWAKTFAHSARVPRIARAWKTMHVREEVSYRFFAVLAFKTN